MQFSEFVERLKNQAITIEEAAEALEVPDSTIAEWEKSNVVSNEAAEWIIAVESDSSDFE
jgi:hypothetical protein